MLVTFGRTSPVDRQFKGQEERGGSLVATSRQTRELGEKEVEVWLLRADELVSLESKIGLGYIHCVEVVSLQDAIWTIPV